MQQACDQRLHTDCRYKSEQKLPRNVRGKSSVYVVKMRSLWRHKTGMQPKQGGEIVERHSGKNLLHNERALFA